MSEFTTRYMGSTWQGDTHFGKTTDIRSDNLSIKKPLHVPLYYPFTKMNRLWLCLCWLLHSTLVFEEQLLHWVTCDKSYYGGCHGIMCVVCCVYDGKVRHQYDVHGEDCEVGICHFVIIRRQLPCLKGEIYRQDGEAYRLLSLTLKSIIFIPLKTWSLWFSRNKAIKCMNLISYQH